MTLLAIAMLMGVGPARTASLTADLVDDLRHGGYVLVMRHASSPPTPPENDTADPANIALEHQLDEKRRATAQAMGKAFKSLHIPVGNIYSSPTYRAREAVKLAHFGTPKDVPELGDQGHSMAHLNDPGPTTWFRTKATEKPAAGRNTILVTHMPNITAAFHEQARDLQDGETLIFKPTGGDHADFWQKYLSMNGQRSHSIDDIEHAVACHEVATRHRFGAFSSSGRSLFLPLSTSTYSGAMILPPRLATKLRAASCWASRPRLDRPLLLGRDPEIDDEAECFRGHVKPGSTLVESDLM